MLFIISSHAIQYPNLIPARQKALESVLHIKMFSYSETNLADVPPEKSIYASSTINNVSGFFCSLFSINSDSIRSPVGLLG